jgi:signal transduction histidine kinase
VLLQGIVGVLVGLALLATPAAATVALVQLVGLSWFVAGIFALVLFGLGRAPSDAEAALVASAAAAAVVSALVWVPTRRRLSPVVTRLVHGERGPPEQALRAFETRLARALPLEELLLGLAETLRRTLALSVAEVWIATDTLLERAASDPARPPATLVRTVGERRVLVRSDVSGAAWATVWLPVLVAGREQAELRVAPIVNAGELLGLVVAERGADGEPFGEDEERVLAELSRRVGLTFRNLRLDSALQASLDELRRQATELRASRARVVAAADAERRRIERDIHDGAQQQLIALAVNLRIARELAREDPVESEAVLEQIGRDLREALADVRSLAHGIYPPLLLDAGLGPALAAAAARSPVSVQVDAPEADRYPADVEATVYFCCLEALQNAAKHAGAAAHVMVRVRPEPGLVSFEVRDDGLGFRDDGHARGAGLQSMADRVGGAGGELSIVSEPGRGTTVTGRVPTAR